MPNYDRAYAAVKKYADEYSSSDGIDLALGLADAIAGLAGASGAVSGVISGLSLIKALPGDDALVVPNIHFVQNGLERPSPLTYEYMRNRSLKNFGAVAVTIAGGAASGFTGGVNTTGMAKELNAAGSTGAHLYKLNALLQNKRWEKSKTVKEWIQLTITMKQHKLGDRAINAAGNASVFVAIPAVLASAFHKLHVKATYGAIVNKTAADIHWRAHQEQVFDKGFGSGTGKGAVGPATSIVHEIFARRGITGIFGKYKANEIIAEPAGWLALADKLSMM
jgi:hypothetical protein